LDIRQYCFCLRIPPAADKIDGFDIEQLGSPVFVSIEAVGGFFLFDRLIKPAFDKGVIDLFVLVGGIDLKAVFGFGDGVGD
jgi:hypothetical protein